MSEPLTSNERLPGDMRGMAAYIETRPKYESDSYMASAAAHLRKGADTIERLTAELTSRAALREALKVTEDEVVELKAERDRLTIERDNAISQAQFAQSERERMTATVEELRTVSAGLRAALEQETQRLDYVERRFHTLAFTKGDTWFKLQPYGEEPKRYGSMREAIDEALAGQPSETSVCRVCGKRADSAGLFQCRCTALNGK